MFIFEKKKLIFILDLIFFFLKINPKLILFSIFVLLFIVIKQRWRGQMFSRGNKQEFGFLFYLAFIDYDYNSFAAEIYKLWLLSHKLMPDHQNPHSLFTILKEQNYFYPLKGSILTGFYHYLDLLTFTLPNLTSNCPVACQ